MDTAVYLISITHASIIFLIISVVFFMIIRRFSTSKKDRQKIEEDISTFSRNQKKQHYAATNDQGTLFPINIKEYTRYFFVKGGHEKDIVDQLTEYAELNRSEEFEEFSFSIGKKGDWFVVKVDANISFYDFHNGSLWIEIHQNIERVYGLAIHENDVGLTYYHHKDYDNPLGDTQIGTFGAKRNFFVYLPGAYEEHGNLKISSAVKIHFSNPEHLLSFLGFTHKDLNSLSYSLHQIKL